MVIKNNRKRKERLAVPSSFDLRRVSSEAGPRQSV